MNLRSGFTLGDWTVYPLEGRLVGEEGDQRVQPKSMDVLLYLAENAGTVVERDAVLHHVWGERAQSDEPLTRCIGELRRALRDTRTEPDYILTIPKRGYRLLKPVAAIATDTAAPAHASGLTAPQKKQRLGTVKKIAIAGVILLVAALVEVVFERTLDETDLQLGSDAPSGTEAVTAATQDENSIVVLPFVNMSDDVNNEYFSDGISEELLNLLTEIPNLRVISRTSAFSYKDKAINVPTIAAQLNVAHVLEGSVRRTGNNVRITAQLIDARSDTHLWSETYDRELTAAGIFAIQTEIATAVADGMRARITPEKERLISSVPTESLAALEAYFQGKHQMGKRTTEATVVAQEFFEQAIALDPDLSLAWAGLAQNYVLQVFNSGVTDGVLFEKAEAAIKRALELEDQLGEAHAALGRLLQQRGDDIAAELAMQRAIELSPNNAYANHAYGLFLDFSDRATEAVEYLLKAKELDPRSPVELVGYGGIMERLGRFDEAFENFERSIEVDPMFAPGFRLIGHLDWRVNARLDKAVEAYAKAIELDPGRVVVPANVGSVYLDLGDLAMAESWISHVQNMASGNFFAARSGMLLDVYRGRSVENFRYPGDRHTTAFNSWPALGMLIEEDLSEGRGDRPRQRLETAFPGLMASPDPEINRLNLNGAIDLAYLLLRTGEQDAANDLLNRCLSFAQSIPRLGWTGMMIADARIYALQGKTRESLEAFRVAIDEGWRTLWWYYAQFDPALESIREEPAFQAMVNELEADMATQLARLKQTEYYLSPESALAQ